MRMKKDLTQAENRFFDMLEDGHKASNQTTTAAKCGKAYSTVLKRMGLLNNERYYVGPNPITKIKRQEIKNALYDYNENHAANHFKLNQKVKINENDIIERLKNFKAELEKEGYTVEIELTKNIYI